MFEIEKFDPTVEELNKLVVASVALNDQSPINEVKQARIQLKTARVAITKKGKEMRDDALAFQRAVIAKEKELIAIIEPEEERLSQLEEAVKEKKLREERLIQLPGRQEILAQIGDKVGVADEYLLGLDDTEFATYVNERRAAKIEADRLALEQEQERVRKEAEAMERERETREREAAARKQAEEEAAKALENERKAHELRIQQEREDAERRVKEERERLEAEQRAKAEAQKRAEEEAAKKAQVEKEKMEKEKKYKAWLKENGYTPEEQESYYFEDRGDRVVMYKKVGVYIK